MSSSASSADVWWLGLSSVWRLVTVRTNRPQFLPICLCVCVWSLVLEVVLESLRQWECVDVMDALPAQSQSSYSSAEVHEGEGLRCEGQERGETWWGSKQAVWHQTLESDVVCLHFKLIYIHLSHTVVVLKASWHLLLWHSWVSLSDKVMSFCHSDIGVFYANAPYGFIQTWQHIYGVIFGTRCTRGSRITAGKQLWIEILMMWWI